MNAHQETSNGFKRAFRLALIVGTALVCINQSNRLMNGPYDLDLLIRVALTYLTPFFVSLFSSFRTKNESKLDQLQLQEALDASIRFPTMNPNPILRIDFNSGNLIFSNEAAESCCLALSISKHQALKPLLLEQLRECAKNGNSYELTHEGKTYEFAIVFIETHGFLNLYGKDITTQQALNRFPMMNPNPVFRVGREHGELRFSNASGQRVCAGLLLNNEAPLPPDKLAEFRHAAVSGKPLVIENMGRTYEISIVDAPDFGFLNAYGTDVTAQRALTRFPAMNPNPVLRVGREQGELRFSNASAQGVCAGLLLTDQSPLKPEQLARFRQAADSGEPLVVENMGRIYELSVVDVPGFGFLNAYGTDVTAQRALTRFPAMNPNPVLRVARDTGELRFKNDAAEKVCLGLSLTQEMPLSLYWRKVFTEAADSGVPAKVQYQNQHFELKVVDVEGFDFLNAYGRDVTAQYMVEHLNAENRRLLLNVLPMPIIKRLHSGESLIADRIPEMSVLFADLVGFTELSSRLAPEALISLLNDIFSEFDTLAGRYELEKIKTIGDAYMVVGGLSGATDHTERLLALAIDMQRAVKKYSQSNPNHDLKIRIGVHVGEGVAGVIGTKKFIYDVWGDTVNIASRMESNGRPGRIQVTRQVVESVGDNFQFESHGLAEIKGKGQMELFLLTESEPDSEARAKQPNPNHHT